MYLNAVKLGIVDLVKSLLVLMLTLNNSCEVTFDDDTELMIIPLSNSFIVFDPIVFKWRKVLLTIGLYE